MSEEITNTDLMAKMVEIHADMKAGLKQAAEERQAIRDVVDHELAGQRQVNQLEEGQRDVLRLLRQQAKKIDTLGERLDRAKV